MNTLQTALAAILLAPLALHAQTDDWKSQTIEPVTNPIFFEGPQITSSIRPIFIHHNIDKSFITGGGEVRVYAAQIRYALTERLALIATKDGYIDFDAGNLPDGWADLAAGLKYALIDKPEQQFILTPGLRIELPTGNTDVFQGNGSGEWDLFISTAKGCGKFNVTANVGARIPNDFSEETSSLHYSLQLDYQAHKYFTPFIAGNGFTTLSEADQLPLNVEGFDLINFGSQNARRFTQIAVGAGFRSRLHEKVDVGFAYEKGVTSPKGLFDDRFTVDLIWRF